jgi:nucleoside-diphosphate-sugar epimerase
MNILILGCGVIGTLVGKQLATGHHQVLGVRRRARTDQSCGFPIVTGDIADPALHVSLLASLSRVDAVLLSANPGVRRGQDNGLVTATRLVSEYYPQARLVYTGTTSVYGDAHGQGVNETTPIDRADATTNALMAIEDAVLAHKDAIILRATALVGPSRTFSRDKIRAAVSAGQPCVVAGDVHRPFSYLHELDLVDLCLLALSGELAAGLYNAAAPRTTPNLTVGGYYSLIAQQDNRTCEVTGDGQSTPARWIDSVKLLKCLPHKPWRQVTDQQ